MIYEGSSVPMRLHVAPPLPVVEFASSTISYVPDQGHHSQATPTTVPLSTPLYCLLQ